MGNSMVGSWRIGLCPDGGTSLNHTLATIVSDGTLLATPPPVERFPLAEEGAIFVGTCHGAWRSAGNGAIEIGFVGQATNSKGTLEGIGSVHSTLQLDQSGSGMSGQYHFEIASPDESVLATEDGTVRGIRITADAPELARYLPANLAVMA